MSELSPMMRHYIELKEKYKDCILFYRLGDFYEMFFDDAILASRELEIVLTGRDCGLPERAPMCGVPYHSAQNYIDRLIAKGYKVAICEQLSDPAKNKGLVERDVIRVVTPGTVVDTASVAENENNYLLSLCVAEGRVGLAYTDVSTGAFYVSECAADEGFASVLGEVARIQPREIIYRAEDAAVIGALETAIKEQNIFVSEYPSFLFEKATAVDSLLRHFGVASLHGYGLSEDIPGVFAAGALIDYLKETQKNALSHINTIQYHAASAYMALDMFTRANLELTKTLREGRVKGSLYSILDKTKTAMGARLLKRSINEPLQNIQEINERLDAVQELKDSVVRMDQVAAALDGIYDLDRLITRISYGTLDARNCLALKSSLQRLPALKNALAGCSSVLLRRIHDE
ncbi:MAG: DNA mismatch repair protein MutS, partial [Christensenellaceae bacterium]|nr:DNA mismatch repair protein MutS [Christensenellaceae bacterium]